MTGPIRAAVTGVGALVLYGGWAWWANAGHGAQSAAWAAATQGLVSGSITFGITVLMEGLARRSRHRLGRFAMAAGGGMGVSATYAIGMHWLMGTPEIVRTLAPIFAVGGPYCLIYAAFLAHRAPDQERPSSPSAERTKV